MLIRVLETKACKMCMIDMIIESYCHKPPKVHNTLLKTILIASARLTSCGALNLKSCMTQSPIAFACLNYFCVFAISVQEGRNNLSMVADRSFWIPFYNVAITMMRTIAH